MSWPCTECGACCTWCRVVFTDQQLEARGRPLLEGLSRPAGPGMRVFKGTDEEPRRCIALRGVVGESVSCAVYGHRPTPCRVFEASWENGRPNRFCDEARFLHGLPPIEAPEWRGQA